MVVAGRYPSTQRPAPSQESVPSQAPPFEVPTQAVVAGRKPSAGQAADVPLQLSATSQALAEARHTVVAGERTSAGQAPEEPVQLSATSQAPAEARHVVVVARKPSTQTPAPLQESAPSHAPPFEVPTQGVVAGLKPLDGQAPEEPVQLAATSH